MLIVCVMTELQKDSGNVVFVLADLLMVNDSGKLSEVMWLSAEYSACHCGKCIFSNTDQVMFQFLSFRHLARDQPASQVLNPFKDLPIYVEAQSNSPGCGTQAFKAFQSFWNGAVSVLRPKILFYLGN